MTVETTLDPAVQPFLDDHRIDGTPVLPGVMGIEGFAEAALSVAPGWQVEAVEDIDFLAPFKFYRGEPRPVTIEARFHPEGDGLVADCRLTGTPRPRQPGRSARAKRTSPAASGWRSNSAKSASGLRSRRRPRIGHRCRGHLPRLLPRPGLPGAEAGVVG